MKKNIIIIALLSAGLFAGCYKDEAALTPTEIASMSRFEFPEGNEEHDKIFSDIYDKFGVQVIYKNWTQYDWQKSWTNPSAALDMSKGGFHFSNGEVDPLTQTKVDTLTLAAKFMRDIFRDLGTDVTSRIFPQYIYLVNSYYEKISFGSMVMYGFASTATTGGMDYQIVSPLSNRNFLPGITPTANVNGILNVDPLETHKMKLSILLNLYFKAGITKGVLAYPAGFNDGMDFSTAINRDDPENPNYYLTRGFTDIIPDTFARVEAPNNATYPSRYPAYYVTNPTYFFLDYLKVAMFTSEAEVNQKYGAYPLVMERYNRVVNYMMDNYGIDLKGMAVYN